MNHLSRSSTRRGFSLIELTVGLVLTSLAAAGINSAVLHVRGWSTVTAVRIQADMKLQALASILHSQVSGINSLQGLSLRLETEGEGPVQQSSGAGFYVEKDVDINGVSSPGNDRLTLITRDELPVSISLNSIFQPGSTTIIFHSSTPSVMTVEQAFPVGSLVALTTFDHRSELIRIASPPTQTNGADQQYSVTASWFAPTFSPTIPAVSIQHVYPVGAFVYRTKLTAIGYNTETKRVELKSGPRTQNLELEGFSVAYRFKPSANCVGVELSSTAEQFDRAHWSTLNSGNYSGYRCIERIRIKAFQGKEYKLYEFITNI